jgi:hypothetical protein
MKFTDILLEQPGPSKAIIDKILSNSGLQNSPRRDEFADEITNKLYTRFRQIQSGLKPGLPPVDTFLSHFDGRHGARKFEGDLKDITKYSIEQLRFLVDEYTSKVEDDANNVETRELLTKTEYNDETAEISKKLWYDESSALINLPGFRVYQPMNQADSIKYGWYEEKMMNLIRPGHHAWCITWRRQSNRWGAYRGDGGTFYFIIDESKLPSDDIDTKKYYLCALQIISRPNHPTGYEVTDIRNPGEITKTWGEIINIYPQLADFKDILVPLPYSNEELEIKSVVGSMTEREGDQYEFSRMPRIYKKQYIDELQKITKPRSWEHMDDKLRASYITLTPAGDFRNRFSNFELLRAVKKSGMGKLLNSEMIKKEKNEGIKSLSEYLMKDLRVDTERVGIVNENIILYVTGYKRYGLWDNRTSDWLTKNGNTYEPSYVKFDEQVIENPKTKETFYVDKFGESAGNNTDYFVAITPLVDIDSYFLSKSAWEAIQDKFTTDASEMMVDKAQDINEE